MANGKRVDSSRGRARSREGGNRWVDWWNETGNTQRKGATNGGLLGYARRAVRLRGDERIQQCSTSCRVPSGDAPDGMFEHRGQRTRRRNAHCRIWAYEGGFVLAEFAHCCVLVAPLR